MSRRIKFKNYEISYQSKEEYESTKWRMLSIAHGQDSLDVAVIKINDDKIPELKIRTGINVLNTMNCNENEPSRITEFTLKGEAVLELYEMLNSILGTKVDQFK